MILNVTNKNKKGFALLFSVLLSSLLLTIGLSIFSIALKELAISSASQRSINAFYAADSGRECALYWDTKRGEIPNLFDDNKTTGNINCGYNSTGNPANIILSTADVQYDAALPTDSTAVTIIFPASTFVTSDSFGPNFNVEINKILTGTRGSADQYLTTNIIATGHDSIGGDRVEREIKETF